MGAHVIFAYLLLKAPVVIVLNLTCAQDHRFEGWFASHEAFEEQLAASMVACPVCGAHEVRKLPSAPHVQRVRAMEQYAGPKPAEQIPELAQLMEQLRAAADASEDVGERFPEEARRIHRGDSEERAIKGQASADEMKSLLEEGISVLPVPPAKEDMH
jgi:hypothetical protein